MQKYLSLLLLLSFFACQEKKSSDQDSPTHIIVNDTIPEIRKTVKTEPVAWISETISDKDKLNNWKFAVDAYETDHTFKYLLKIQYMELKVEDTLTVPNFGIQPRIKIILGKAPQSFIVGFIGNDKEFMDVKKIYIEKGNLRIKRTKSYARTLKRKSN